MKEKIILGTVQLGIPYGINNATGKPSEAEAFKILDFAFEQQIRMLDSADSYGDALKVIGKHRLITGKVFKIINKFTIDNKPLDEKIQDCLRHLSSSSLYCYMYHHFKDYISGKVKQDLDRLKEGGTIERIGVSIYHTGELAIVLKDPQIDIIQLPVNILDLTLEKRTLLQEAKDKGKEIHARSIYLQGLLLKNPASLTGNLVRLRPYLDQLQAICETYQMNLKDIALNCVIHNHFIDYIVLGIEQVSQLEENIRLIWSRLDGNMLREIEKIQVDNPFLLNPANWKP